MMNESNLLRVFTSEALDELLSQMKIQKPPHEQAIDWCRSLASRDGSTQAISWKFGDGSTPQLKPSPDEDGNSAVSIHRYLGSLSPLQASDRRLWSYLSSVVFSEYTMQRWPNPSKTWHTDRLLVTNSNYSNFSKNSISRLWYTAEKLYDPDLEQKLSKRSGNPYQYVSLMFHLQDIQTALLQRSTVYNSSILYGFIDAIADSSPKPRGKTVQRAVRELNFAMGFHEMSGWSSGQCEDLIMGVFGKLGE